MRVPAISRIDQPPDAMCVEDILGDPLRHGTDRNEVRDPHGRQGFDAFLPGQDRGAIVAGGVRVWCHPGNESVCNRPFLVQTADVVQVQEVEDAIGEDSEQALPQPKPRPGGMGRCSARNAS
jgi:hypothetical protein